MKAAPQKTPTPPTEVLVRELLARVADKWTLMVIDALAEGPLRFTQLQKKVGGVSQKMLTKTVRQLERDGLLSRTVHPVVPPRVDYQLTPLGESLGETVCPVWIWVEQYAEELVGHRQAYDAAHPQQAPSSED